MNDKKLSNERLNEHKKHTNVMISENYRERKSLSRINEKYFKISNVPEIYRDKIYDLYNSFRKQGIDFWGREFPLREAILFHFELKTLESEKYLHQIMEQILLLPNTTIINKILNEAAYQSMEKEINSIEKIAKYIHNYEIEKDLNTTLMDYFKNMPVAFEIPQSIKNKYQRIKSNIEDLGMIDILQEKELEEIIAKKSKECLNYKIEKDPLYTLLLELDKIDEEENKNSTNQRTKK